MKKTNPKIVVDTRESRKLKKALVELGCELVEESITSGDYVLSESCAVERKTIRDFMQSIYDGRLFEQVERLAKVYQKSVLIVEGELQTLKYLSNPAVFWGALATVTANHEISVTFTRNLKDTAMFLRSLARQLQEEKGNQVITKHNPKFHTLSQRQLLTVQNLPNIGPTRAEKLLTKFGSLRKIFLASDNEIMSINGLGKKTVQEIRKLLDTEYLGQEQT